MFFHSLELFGTRIVLILFLLGRLAGVENVQAAKIEPGNPIALRQNGGAFPSVVVTSPRDGDVLLNNPSTLSVQFSTDMLADGSAFAVNLAGNYLLVEDGADGKFQTVSCATQRAGDDTRLTIKSVAYNAATYTSTLTVDTWPSLNQASYQLLVCASTRITDPAGNRLNDGADTKIRFVLLKDVDLYPYDNLGGGYGEGAGIGDFNHDGLMDVVMSLGSQIQVHLQGSSGTFSTPVSYPAGARSEALAVGDLNHDGWVDVVTADFSSNTISVFLQQADGALAPRTTYATSSSPDSIAVGDVTGDGLQDVVVSHWNAPSIGVYAQNANGTLNSMTSYAAPSAGGDDIAIGDVNHDGRNDVVNMNGQTTSPNLSVYLQNASGTLDAAVSYSHTCSGCGSGGGVAIGDITGDGLGDVVMSLGGNRPSSRIALFPQGTNGQLQTSVLYDSYDIPGSAEIADINQDGAQDFLVLHDGWKTLGVYLQKDGQLQPESLYTIPNINQFNPQALAIGDINQDGAVDAAIADNIYGMTILYYHERSAPRVIQGGSTSPVEGEEVGQELSQVSVQFDQPMKADSSASAANIVSNYLLVESGPDRSFQTNSCSVGPAGDDVGIVFNDVQYDAAGYSSTLHVNSGALLGAGQYRLLVCSTIEDVQGVKLNGGVSDETITFTVWPTPHKISGNAGVAMAVLAYEDNGPRSVVADGMGDYSLKVSDNWSGTVTPSRANYTFNPASKSYAGVSGDLANENYAASLIMFTISGNTGMGNVPLYFYPPGEIVYSDVNGNYSYSVPSGWTFSVYPAGVSGYRFIPEYRSYAGLQGSQANQDFVPQRVYTISGNAGAPGVTLSYLDGTTRTATSDNRGNYSFVVPEHWSGTVTPAKSSYIFTPSSLTYTDVVADQLSQNYKSAIVVANTNNSGAGSLRQAVADAVSGSTITFAPSLSGGTILLATQIDINKDLTIDGSGLSPRITISGNKAVRIFSIGNNYTVNLKSLILRDGFMTGTNYAMAGGAIFANSGTLNITNVAFIGNQAYQAGALYISPYANVTIQDSEFTSNSADYQGGAILVKSLGNLTMKNSLLQTNSAGGGSGGAVFLAAAGTRLLENNTFSQNTAGAGGAIVVEQTSNSNVILRKNLFSRNISTHTGSGGGALRITMSSIPAVLTIENNTFHGNQAASIGGAVLSEGQSVFTNNTFSDNQANKAGGNAGASLFLSSGFGTTLYNNILANNTGGGECAQFGSNYITGVNNLVEDGSTTCASLPGTVISDPMLGAITDNGGSTQTMALLPGSPAIDSGNDANCTTTDQRGTSRPQGLHCDLGAYEYVFPPTATPTFTPTFTPTYTPTNTPTPAVFTLVLQPDGAGGVDTFIYSSSKNSNFGTSTDMGVGEDNTANNRIARSLLRFDLSSIPANATINSATLSLWTSADLSSNNRTIRVYRLKKPFSETQATWSIAASGSSWQTAGASGANDRESTAIGSVSILNNEALNVEKQIVLTPGSIQEMVNGTFVNRGFLLQADTESNDRFNYRTSDSTASGQRPKLVIRYTVHSATPTNTPAATSTPTATPTTASRTPTPSFTPTATGTATFTSVPPTVTSSRTSTPTSTPWITFTSSPMPTNTYTATPGTVLSVQLLQPNGGEVLTVGNTYRITWNSSSNIDKVTLGYKACDSCLDWIATNIPNTGYYDWNVFVGNTTNTQFRIYIIAYHTGVGSVTDVSDNLFTVLQPTPTATVTKTFTPTLTATTTATLSNTFPVSPVLDNFNRTDGMIGTNWSGYPNAFVIASSRLDVTASGWDTSILWNASSLGADQEAYVTFSQVDGGSNEQSLILKSQSSTGSAAGLIQILYNGAGKYIQVWTYHPGQGWVQYGANLPVTLVNGDQLGARARPDGSLEVYRNGTLLATRTITAWPYYAGGGYVGLWMANAPGALLDNFGGGTR